MQTTVATAGKVIVPATANKQDEAWADMSVHGDFGDDDIQVCFLM